MDPIKAFLGTIDQTGRIVAGVGPDQLGLPTPCGDWDVRTLLSHTVAALEKYDAAIRGDAADPARPRPDAVGDDPAQAYARAASSIRDATRPGVVEMMWAMPSGETPGMTAIGIATIEMQQHGWDIARATRQAVHFDPEVAEEAMTAARRLTSEFGRNPDVFGPEVECRPDAPVHDRLAAFLGRTVSA